MENKPLIVDEYEEQETEYNKLNILYDECLKYLEKSTPQTYETLNNFKEINQIIVERDADNISDGDVNDTYLKEDFYDVTNKVNKNEHKKLSHLINNDINELNANEEYSINREIIKEVNGSESPIYYTIKDEVGTEKGEESLEISGSFIYDEADTIFDVENEFHTEIESDCNEIKSERLKRLTEQLPKIIITQSQSNTSLNKSQNVVNVPVKSNSVVPIYDVKKHDFTEKVPNHRYRSPYTDYPKRLVSKHGAENVALISNVPYEKLRMLNDTFHTLINLRWRWIVTGTVVVHFAIWFVFAVFWYIASLAHYDFEPDPPQKACITGGKDFVTIFLASVEAQTTIGFGDRTVDEECPESIFLFIMQLILGTGLSGVLTCVVYAKLTRPEKLSRDGVGFSKKAVVCMRDGRLCLMLRAWDLNYDHIISSDFSAHFVNTYRTKEGEVIRYYARSLELQQRQFLLWPVTLVHVIDENSPLYNMIPENFINYSYEITVSLKGASASMGTFTQSQTSYLPREVLWGYRFPSVVRYDNRKQKYVIDHRKLELIEQVDTPLCSAQQLYRSMNGKVDTGSLRPDTPGSFSEKVSAFTLERSSSFRRKTESRA